MSKINTKIIKKKKLNTADNLEKQISGSFRCTKNRENSVPLLYRLVYSSRLSFITVFILLLSFVFQGASLTYADEITDNNLPELNNITPEPSEQITSEVTPEEEQDEVSTVTLTNNLIDDTEDITNSIPLIEETSISNDLLVEEVSLNVEDDSTSDTSPPLDDPPITGDDIQNSDDDSESLPNDDVLSVTDTEIATSTATSTATSEDIIPEDVAEEDTQLPEEEVSEVVQEESASTTETVLTESSTTTATTTTELIEEAVTVTNSDTEFTFNRNECTTLASGSFYCLKAETETLQDALFAAPDVDGDLEIYLVREGIQSQVTSNLVDDAAPFFDQNSDSIVWHRLINDRYQVISYDISSGNETQLTFGETNSMEPTRQGRYTVWQNWSNNNWNIVLFDGTGERTITESSAHDIAPYIHGSLVVWNRYNNGQDKTIEMYDMISETYVTVDDPEGLSVTNPRMVFVYDSLHPNGDVVTKGYDMISRKFIQLDTLPRQLPDEIPESESTGETRALIQSKPSVKSDESIQNGNATSSGPTPPIPTVATTSDPLTLDMTATTSSAVAIPPQLEVPAMAEYELIIPPLELQTETVQE